MERMPRNVVAAVAALLAVVGPFAVPAAANPDTPVAYRGGGSASRVSATAFDTCSAPSLSELSVWKRFSPYRALNAYIGGVNRACAQPNLTRSWVRSARRAGWRLIPTYVGYQSSCTYGLTRNLYSASSASSRGASDAADAVASAKALGMRPGSAIYADLEHYDRSRSMCRTAARRYVSAWTRELHAAGYLAGVYAHQRSGVRDLAASYTWSSYARPDAIWMARWDGSTSLRDWTYVPNSFWSLWQRAKQYRGDHSETWGGVTLRLDTDRLKAPVATVALTYRVTSSGDLNGRSGPSTSSRVVRRFASRSSLHVVCQARGQKIHTTRVWDRLASGVWVSDYFVSTPSSTGFTGLLPRCSYPGQVSSSNGLNARTGPGTSYPVTGRPLPAGSLAWVVCQRSGSTVGTTRVWDRLRDGRWVSDYYVRNRSTTSWSYPVPRCA